MGTNGKGKFQDGHGREPEELAINPAEARQELVATLESTKAEIERLFNEFKTANQDQLDLIREAEAALAKAMKKIGQLKSIEAVVARKETLVASLENLKSKGQGTTEQLSVLEQRLKNAETDFASRSGEIFRKVINLETKVELVGFKTITEENVAEFGDEELVDVDVPFLKGLPGQVTFLLEKGFTAKVVDWMIMGDGEVEFMPEEHLDGIVEAVNELMGNELTELSARVGISLRNEVRPAYLETPDNIKKYYLGCHAAKFEVKIDIGDREHPKERSFVMWKLIAPETGQRLGEWLVDRPVEKPDEESEDANLEQVREAEAPGVAPVGPEAPAVASESPAPERRIISIEKCLSHIHGRVGVDESIIQRYEAEIDTLKTKLEGESFGLPILEDDLSAGLQEIMSRFDAEVGGNPVADESAPVELEHNRVLEEADFRQALAEKQDLNSVEEYLYELSQADKIINIGDGQYWARVLWKELKKYKPNQDNPKNVIAPRFLKDILERFGFLEQGFTHIDIPNEEPALRRNHNEPSEFRNPSLRLGQGDFEAILNEASFADFYEALSTTAAHGLWVELDSVKYLVSDLRDRAKAFRDGDQTVDLPEVIKNRLLGFVSAGAENNATEQAQLIQRSIAELDATFSVLRADAYGDNAERAAELIQHSLEEIQALDQNLDLANLERQILEINANLERKLEQLKVVVPEAAPAAPAPEPEVPAEEADQTQKWFEGRDKLKMVDISPEKIKEILQNTEVVANLKSFLLNAEGGGVEAFQENIVLVLKQYFAEQNLQLSPDKQVQLEQMIANLSNEVAQQVTDSFAIALEAKATKETQGDGFLQKFKKTVVSLTGAQFGTTLAVGLGVSALVTVFAPAAIGVGGAIVATGALAGLGRFGVGLGFDKLRKVLNHKKVLSEKEQIKLQASKQEILEGTDKTKAEFVNLGFLSAVISNTIRTNTLEDFMQYHIRDEDGTISADTLDTLKQNIENLLNNDPRYAHLDEAARREEAKKLMTVLGLNLVEEANIFFDFKNEATDPKMIQAMKRAQGFLSGKVNTDNKFAQAGAAMLVGAGMKIACSSSKTVAASTGALSGALMGWSFGAGLERARAVEEYSLQLEKMLNSSESELLETVSISDMQDEAGVFDGEKFRNLSNSIIRVKNYLAAKDETGYLITDPIVRARAENFVHQFNQVQARELRYGDSDNAPGGPVFENIERALNRQQELLDYDRESLRETLAKKVAKGVSETRVRKLALATLGAMGFGLFGFVMGGAHDVNAQENANVDLPVDSGQDSLVAPEDSLAQQAASTVDSTQAAGINLAETVSVGGAGAAAAATQAAAEHASSAGLAAGVSVHHFEDVIHTEDGGSADSIWRSTRDIVKAHPSDFGYHGTDDAGEIARFAETQTANLVHQLDQAQGGHLADLVHEGDKVSIDFVDSKPVLHFEDSSGLEAGHLSDIHHAAPSAVEHTPAPEVAPVVPVTPTLENISSDAFVNKVFESSQDVQEKFLHDIDPNHFTGANNKAEIFLKTITESQKIKLEDINSLEELQKHLAAFDRLVDNKSLPGNTWTPRLFSDGQGHEIYALVKAKGGLFSFLGEKQYLVDTTGGKPFSISETGLRNMLENHNVNINEAQNVITENPLVEPKVETPEAVSETQIIPEGGIDFAGTYSAAERANILEHLRGKNIEFENLRTQFAQLAVNPEYNQNPNWLKFSDMYKQSLQEHLSDYSKIKADLVDPNIQLHLETNISGNMTLEEAANMKAGAEIRTLLVNSGVRSQAEIARDLLGREIPVAPELATGVDTTFEQLSRLKEGDEFHHDDLVIFKQDGKLFTWDLSEKNLLEVRNQADLDRFAGK